MNQSTETSEPTTIASLGEALAGWGWVRAIPAPLLIVLAFTIAVTGLWVSEHSFLYGPLGFPSEVGHSPLQLMAQPVLLVLVVVAALAWIILRQPAGQVRRSHLEWVLYGSLIFILVYGCVLAWAQASQAQAAFRAGKPVDSPALAPLSLHAPLAEAEWRPDVPSNTWKVGDGAVLYVGRVGGVFWFWDADKGIAAAVPATQLSIVRMQPSGAKLARHDVPTTMP